MWSLFRLQLQPDGDEEAGGYRGLESQANERTVDATVRMVASFSSKSPALVAEYFRSVGMQLLEMLRLPAGGSNALMHRAAAAVVVQLLDRSERRARSCIFGPLFEPLLRPAATAVALSADTVATESELGQCIHTLHALLSRALPTDRLLAAVAPAVPWLFRLHCAAARSRAHVLGPATDSLAAFFKLQSPGAAAATFVRMLRPVGVPGTPAPISLSAAGDVTVYDAGVLEYAPGPSGGIEARRAPARGAPRSVAFEADRALALLATAGRPELDAEVLDALLCDYDACRRTEGVSRDAAVLHTLAALLESRGETLVADVPRAMRFVQRMLEGGDDEMLTLSLGLLDAVVHGIKNLGPRDTTLLQELVPALGPLAAHRNPDIASLANELRTAIAVRDPSWVAGASHSTDAAAPEVDRTMLDLVLRDVQDEMAPVRTHALIELRKLVLAKDPATIRNVPMILELFSAALLDRGSGPYLTAINGLATLGEAYPERVIPIVAQEYGDAQRPLEHRLKLGEVLARIARGCGDLLPHRAPLFMHVLFSGCRDPDATLRASSLSALANVCQLLGWSVQAHVGELVECTTAILGTDPEPEPRRGAAHLLAMLLQGLGDRAFDALGRSLKQILRVLRGAADAEEDHAARCHCRIALAEIDDMVARFNHPDDGTFVPK